MFHINVNLFNFLVSQHVKLSHLFRRPYFIVFKHVIYSLFVTMTSVYTASPAGTNFVLHCNTWSAKGYHTI